MPRQESARRLLGALDRPACVLVPLYDRQHVRPRPRQGEVPGLLVPADGALEVPRGLVEGLEREVDEALATARRPHEHRASDRREWERLGVVGLRVARDDQARPDRARAHEAVEQLESGEHPAAAVRDVERERAVRTCARGMTRVCADVLLNQRRERGLGEIVLAVEPCVDEQIDVARFQMCAGEARARGLVGELQRSLTERPAAGVRRGDGFNARAHSDPPARPSGR